MGAVDAVPVIDLSQWRAEGVDQSHFLADLRDAAHELGAFYLTGHGIDPARADELFRIARSFFMLPDEQKRRIDMVNSPHFRGYTRIGAELTRGRPDWREQLDIGVEVDAAAPDPGAPVWKRLLGPNQWPAALPALRPAALQWHELLMSVARRLLAALAEALGQRVNVFDEICAGPPNRLLKIIRYPGRDQTESDQGCGPHKDGGFVTFVRQQEVSGLQLQVDDRWVNALPIPNTFFVNIGELLEIATNGYLRAAVHRVVTPPVGADRLSLAFFLGGRLDAVVPHLTLPGPLAAQARGIEQDPLNPLYSEVGLNALKGRLRSHPDVARRHYADLVSA